MAMKRNQPAGGMGSRVVKEVPVRTGKSATGVRPAAISQIGSSIGNKVTEEVGGKIPYRGEDWTDKKPLSVPMGNTVALNVGKGGPGTGRTIMPCGSQTGVSPVRSPNASGKDILRDYGPDVPGRR